MKNQNKHPTIKGEVQELLPNAQCKVLLENGQEIRCYIAGRMRINKISVSIGDTVELIADEFGHLGRIVSRK